MLNIEKISSEYIVRKLEEKDINDILQLMISNPTYYKYCPPQPSINSIKEDMLALPPNKDYNDKYYFMFYRVSVTITNYYNVKTDYYCTVKIIFYK